MPIRLKSKLWLEKDSLKIFGDGPCDILRRVERTGSLRQAAAEINMSYSQAWRLIRMLENNLGFKVLEKQTGGIGGGHSKLTDRAVALTAAYEQFRLEVSRAHQTFYDQYLGKELKRIDESEA